MKTAKERYAIMIRGTLASGLTILFDTVGSAIIIHGLEDSFLPDPLTKDDPDGPSIACRVVLKK